MASGVKRERERETEEGGTGGEVQHSERDVSSSSKRVAASLDSARAETKLKTETEKVEVEKPAEATKMMSLEEDTIKREETEEGEKGKRERKLRVVIIGAGVAGLAAAKELEADGRFDLVILEARERVGGRIHTLELPQCTDRLGRVLPACSVDLGASYIHGCDDRHPVYKIAKELEIRCDSSSSAETYTENCLWLNHRTGKRIGRPRVVKSHQVMYSAAKVIMETARKKRDNGEKDFPISDIFETALKVGMKRHRIRALSDLDREIIHCAAKRAWQICADFTKLSALQEASWLDEEEETAAVEAEKKAEEKVAAALEVGEKKDADPMEVTAEGGGGAVVKKKEQTKKSARRREKVKKKVEESPTDRIVVDGYFDFLIRYLNSGATLHTNTVVKEVESLPGKCIVSTSDKESYPADFVLVTLPVGVLKGKSNHSNVLFRPELSKKKKEAIETFGMGSENKIVLRFDPSDIFWPLKVPYFISTDDRFRFLNLHYYGKTGVLVVHGQPPFSWNWGGLNDSDLVSEVRRSLALMLGLSKTPDPISSYVTRWDKDHFSMGSYSYFSVDSSLDTVHALASCEGLKGEKRVYFAGEACSVDGHQCVHGAYTTGIEAAQSIMGRIRDDGVDQGPPESGYGSPVGTVQMVQCTVCEKWKEVPADEKELKRISMDDSWTCSLTCQIQRETSGISLCSVCKTRTELILKEKEKPVGKAADENDISLNSNESTYAEGERVLVPENGVVYEAKVEKAVFDPNAGWKYFIHYMGWHKRYDKWFPHSCLRKNEEHACTCGYRRFFA